ncbi:hypothetical protein C0Q70_02463 [Pomacea canaliculata]|uniref:RING-type E3 ubiquitin transferase n=1 Tax=Pomacea canaliculata TaxID=400727 RepID=A0A2T7PQ21_POMCA|nr:hypothetical protein C0Q70_02463 [Pomacea canaliculata]
MSNMLISAGAFVDVENQDGRMPLSYGNIEVRKGVKMFIKNNQSAVKFKTGRGSVESLFSDFGEQDNLEETLRGVGLPCGLCGHPTSDVTLYPCQHKCVCSGCSVAVTCCPLCDEPVSEKIKTGSDVTRLPDSNTQFNVDSTSSQEAGPPPSDTQPIEDLASSQQVASAASDTQFTEGLSDSEKTKPETNNEVLVGMTDSGGSDSGSEKRPTDKESNKQRQKDHEVTERKEEKQEKKEEAPKEEKSMQQVGNEAREFVDLSFASGDQVAIQVRETELKQLQRGFGGCTRGMIKCIGQTGVIQEFAVEGSIPVVSFGSDTNIAYRFNPTTLLKVSEFHVGDTVRIKPDVELLKLLNSKVGWRPQMNAAVGKVGKVQQIDKDKNLYVTFGSSLFLFAPAACVHAPCAPLEVISVGSESQHVDDGSVSESRRLFMKLRESLLSERTVAMAMETLGRWRDCWARSSMTMTSLGHEDIAVLLVGRGADLNHKYPSGDIPLHMAVFKDMKILVQSMIEHGVDVNAKIFFHIDSKDAVKTKFRSSFTFDHPVEVQEALQGLEMPCGVCFLAQSCQSAALSTQTRIVSARANSSGLPLPLAQVESSASSLPTTIVSPTPTASEAVVTTSISTTTTTTTTTASLSQTSSSSGASCGSVSSKGSCDEAKVFAGNEFSGGENCRKAAIESRIGIEGVVTAVPSPQTPAVSVKYTEKQSYRLNPAVLVKITSFTQGDVVRVRSDAQQVRFLNKSLGWSETMEKVCGKVGRVRAVDSSCHVTVRLGSQELKFHARLLDAGTRRTTG